MNVKQSRLHVAMPFASRQRRNVTAAPWQSLKVWMGFVTPAAPQAKPTGSQFRLTANTSIYLDFLRLCSALAVFLGHANGFFFRFAHAGIVFGHAREAVAVFFVLSGFVIRFVTSAKETHWRDYVIARISRIYPVAVLALLVTWAADRLGSEMDPHYYASLAFFHPESLESTLRYVSFTNQIWFAHTVFGLNEPYWSLGFEVCYYVLFGLVVFLPTRWAWAAAAAWFLVSGPKISLYLPLWLLGVWTAEQYRRQRWALRSGRARLVFVATIILYGVIWRLLARHAGEMYVAYGMTKETINFFYFTAIGLCVSANILSFGYMVGDRAIVPARAARAIRWAAGASFTLYLVHQTLFGLWCAIFPIARHSLPAGLGGCGVTLCAALCLAELAERRKSVFAAWLNAIIGHRAPTPVLAKVPRV